MNFDLYKQLCTMSDSVEGDINYLNNPIDVCDYTVTFESREQSVLEAVRRIVPSWSTALQEDVVLVALTGGITNTMYLLTWKADMKIIVRLFGANTELFIDRKNENSLFAALSGLDMGCPNFYGLFNNGRIEGYLPARAVTPAEMREPYVYLRLAEAAARFHTRGSTIKASSFPHENRMHPQFAEYYDLCTEIYRSASESMRSKMDALELPAVGKELDWLKTWLRTQADKSNEAPLKLPHVDAEKKSVFIPRDMLSDVFNHQCIARALAFQEVMCHYDMLSGNILIDFALEEAVLAGDEENYGGGITLIDYEYSAFTYRAFDLGNFFCEFAGFDRSIEEAYPDEDIRKTVIRAYFDSCAEDFESFRLDEAGTESRIWRYWQGLRRDGSAEATAAAECIVTEFEKCANQLTLCAHMLWYLWGIVQSSNSTVEFDYIDYARVRLEGFRYHKACFHSDSA